MPKQHDLKTDPEVFQFSWEGSKCFEIRKDDRGYKVGDILLLKETEYSGLGMSCGRPLAYTGREIVARVTFILGCESYGLKDDWVVLSVEFESSHQL